MPGAWPIRDSSTRRWRCATTHLRVHGPSADAFCLLGVVHDATGRFDDAEACYRKALYLEPRHEEAVTHLALLVDRRGAADEAKVLWNRARRLAAGGAR